MRHAAAVIAALTASVLTGCGTAHPAAAPRPPTAPVALQTRALDVAPAPAAVSSSSPPVRLQIPSIGVDTALDSLGIDASGVLQAPRTFTRAGWFASGPIPGDPGPAVIAGHVDSRTGPAVFTRLPRLRPGSAVVVTLRSGRQARFVVQDTHIYAKNTFPTSAVYGPTPGPVLRLITCTGDFDHTTGHYRDNAVVTALPLSTSPG